ncbi:MAG: RagB/SusD family nutrient uptake outer membrane protein [Bacteroidales bacterium]
MKIIKYLSFLVLILFSSCNDWLDLEPTNGRLTDLYWQTKSDVHNTMMNCYVRLRGDVQERVLVWGEMRADVLETNDATNLEIKEQNFNTENNYLAWASFYKVINSANSVIENAEKVLDRDPLFTEEECLAYVAEAKIVRALAYFYLVRTFREVPFVLNSYTSDNQDFYVPTSSEKVILDKLKEDLIWATENAKSYYNTTLTGPDSWQNKSRATKWAAYALLADIYLWNEEYQLCRDACMEIIEKSQLKLVSGEEWYKIFYPGLSSESIFELYYDHGNNQTNNLFNWFNKSARYYLNTGTRTLFEETPDDLRGYKKSYYKQDTWYSVWKYMGTKEAGDNGENKRSGNNQSANWIYYRLADIYLIYAEASVFQEEGNRSNYIEAARALNVIKERAGIPLLDEDRILTMSETMFADEILLERKKEFVGEGKRWFDLVRFSKKENFESNYRDLVMNILLEIIPLPERPIFQAKMGNPWRYYLPIHKEEMDRSKGVLIQNPAY